MQVTQTSIARNTSYFTLALILQKVISLSYFTLYARYLGAADLGQYYFAISITSIFGIFIDFGLGNVVTREVAKHPEKARSILKSVLAVKIPLALITILILDIWSYTWGYDPLTQKLIYISAFAMLLDGFTGSFYAIARGFHNLKFESISSVLYQTTIIVFSIIILKGNWGIAWLMGTLVAASLFNFIYSSIMIATVWKIRPIPKWDKQLIRQLFALALPFAAFVIVQRFYTFFDSVLLFKLAGDRAVGLYQVPFKIIIALQFLPMAFVASLYPALSSYWHSNRDRLAGAFEQAIKYCLLIAVPVTLGAIALADKIVLLFKEDFSEAGLLLRVSMIAVPFMFIGFPVGALLNACDQQKRNTINMAITAVASAVLNIILIPRLGVLGACLTTVISSFLMLVLGWLVVPRITPLHWSTIAPMIVRILAAGALMAILVMLVKDYLHPILTIVIAAVIYPLFLFAFKVVSKNEILSFIHSARRKQSSVTEEL